MTELVRIAIGIPEAVRSSRGRSPAWMSSWSRRPDSGGAATGLAAQLQARDEWEEDR